MFENQHVVLTLLAKSLIFIKKDNDIIKTKPTNLTNKMTCPKVMQ